MIQIFKTTDGQLVQIKEPIEGCWINITGYSDETKDWIEQNLENVAEYLTDFQDVDEMSRIEKEDDLLNIVLRIPHFNGVDSGAPFITLPLVIISTDNYIVTACREENVIIQEFIKQRVKGFSTTRKSQFLLLLLFKTATRYLLHLRNINKIVEELEDELENSLRNKELMELLKYEKALIYYTTALKANEVMMERTKRLMVFKSFEEDEELLEDVMIENQQAIEMTNITQKVLDQMTNAYSSVINNNMNNVIKFLTFVTICISIPTLITSFYGMNIRLPGQNSNNAFYFVVGSSLVLILFTLFFFKRKKWF